MEPLNLQHIDKDKVCDLCSKHDPLTRDYAQDFELQTALRNYLEKTTGDRATISDIAKLCDSCYTMIAETQDEDEE